MTPETAKGLLESHRAAEVAYQNSAPVAATRAAWQVYYDAADAITAAHDRLEKAEQALARASNARDKAAALFMERRATADAAFHAAKASEDAARSTDAKTALDTIRTLLCAMAGEADHYDAQHTLAMIVQAARAAKVAADLDAQHADAEAAKVAGQVASLAPVAGNE